MIWRSANVIPVPKPGKPANDSNGYRPISLLAPAAKILEGLTLPDFSRSLIPNNSQHGFRPGRSTVTALLPLATKIATGFNARKPAKRTGLLSIDLSKAFDVVERDKLLSKINGTDLHPNLKRWLAAYLRDRRVRVIYQGSVSSWRKSKLGFPQGSRISPILFIFYEADKQVVAAELSEAYADDGHVAESSSDVDEIATALNAAADEISAWASLNGMSVSAPKSTVTLFTSWTKQVNHQLPVTMDGTQVPTEKNPKLLGVVFDPTFTFCAHAAAIVRKARARMKILRALADSTFGKDKECLIMTFKAFIRPILDYAAAIVHPNLSDSSNEKVQKLQNSCLRLILGCHSAAAISHLHDEAKLLPFVEHQRLLAAQELAKSLQPGHPSYECAKTELGPRNMKQTLRPKCINLVQPYLDENGDMRPENYRDAIKSIHTDVVRNYIANAQPNRILGSRPPEPDVTEKFLPRKTQVTLSQLRSGFCSRLQDYQFRIGAAPNDLCPDCNASSHTVQHLFECNAHPTNLTVNDLWSRPWDVAAFIQSLPAFSFLPCSGPPPPPPRRGRRHRRPPRH